MTTDKPSLLVPKLRFPDFQELPHWPRCLMGRFLRESRIKGSGGHEAKKLTVKLWGKGVFQKHESLRGSANTQYYRRRAGQFIYSKLDFLNQAFGIIPAHLDGFESTVDLPCFDIAPELNAKFLLEYVQRERFYKTFGEIADGGRKAKRIQVKTFLECPIFTPSKPEQQRIADCLGSLDDLIVAEDRKLEALRQHKQGLMQQLFPQPGETVPRLRFPEFDSASEWKSQRLDEVSSSIFDGTHQTPTYTNEGVPFYSVENLISGTANKFISRDSYLEATRKNKPEKGDILLTRIGKIGHSKAVTWDHEFSVYVTLAVIKASPCFDTNYLAHYLQSGCYQAELIRKSLQSAVPPKINLDSLRSTLVLLPDMGEQRKIADCLGSLDDLIAAKGRKLEALRQHKRGLMQQLFPQPDGQ